MIATQPFFIETLPVARKRKRTFLEILQVSHRETVMANLLAYYFQPDEDHGLGDIFIKALLETTCYRIETQETTSLPDNMQLLKNEYISWAKVQTEDSTSDNKRIDIVIETDQMVIAIEFKINHVLNNPLKTYVQHIESLYPKEKAKYYFVLTPTWRKPEEECQVDNNFRQVLFSHLIETVEFLMKKEDLAIKDKESSQFHFFKDFITTVKNRKITFDMIKEYLDRASKNKEFQHKVSDVFEDLQKIKTEFENKMGEVGKQLEGFHVLESSRNKLTSVIEKKINGHAIKLRLGLNGWSLEQWNNNKKMEEKTQTFPYQSNSEKIITKVKELEKSTQP